MILSAEEIRHRLGEFAAKWGGYEGSERAEAQTFLTQLLTSYGTDREAVGAKFEEAAAGKFMDMIWPGVCIVEMKRPSEAAHLRLHRPQALSYWQRAGRPGAPAPPYVVLCAFHRFEVWKPGDVYTQPLAEFDLAELPENSDALLFLAGREPGFFAHDKLSREAVALVTDLYRQLDEREAADDTVLQDFILQIVWSMFAEDLGMLPRHLFTRVLDGLVADPNRSSFDDLGRLFRYLAEKEPRPPRGAYEGTPYANGGLFTRAAEVHLEPDEVTTLRKAVDFDWTQVEPSIFGSLLQGGLGKEKQWAFGAHYTAEADILKVVVPTIVEPWRDRIAACDSVAAAQAAQRDLMQYVVLDPACGSGNFLYVAYRELRRLEEELRARVAELRKAAGLADQVELNLFPIQNLKGIEIEPFAVKLARVTMWIGHKLAVEDLGLDEPVLPLADLSGIRQGDALRVPWPRADSIISNPPYHGDRRLRRELGDEYAEWLRREFGIGLKDYAVYWFRRAHEHLIPGKRAGLVATNSVSQGRARAASLDWITESGGVITNAISTQDWSGKAAVDVSIVNWIKEPSADQAHGYVLDGSQIDEPISASLVPISQAVERADRLEANKMRAFYGCILGAGGPGFILEEDQARKLREKGVEWRDIIRPLLTGEDLAQRPDQQPGRWVVDFGFRTLEEAMNFPEALDIVREHVKPARDRVRRAAYRRHWWRFAEPIRGMRDALHGSTRYIACPAVTAVRGGFCWVAPEVIPTSQATVFAFDDDYAMGILCSGIHVAWASAQSSTLEDRQRYTPTSAFETFPWPDAPGVQRRAISGLAERLIERRRAICMNRGFGLTELYNQVGDGGYADLKALHGELDRAVAAAYGWPASAASDPAESNRRLLDLNQSIAAGDVEYRPFS